MKDLVWMLEISAVFFCSSDKKHLHLHLGHLDPLSKATYKQYICQKKRNNNITLSVQ
jgi:hypothetical protein